jgi:hypothetical protein
MDYIYGDLDRAEKVSPKDAGELISSAKSGLKSSYKEIGEMRKDREISAAEARQMQREALEDFKNRIREIKQSVRDYRK